MPKSRVAAALCLFVANSSSESQPDAPDQVRQPRIGAKGVQNGIHFEINKPVASLFISPLEPFERFVRFAE